jgi:hypothetical protein
LVKEPGADGFVEEFYGERLTWQITCALDRKLVLSYYARWAF